MRDDYEAAIQAGVEALRHLRGNYRFQYEDSKAVIDAAIASGELVERQRLVDCMDENERLARLVEWGEANAHEACSQEVDRLVSDKDFWQGQFQHVSDEVERLRAANELLEDANERLATDAWMTNPDPETGKGGVLWKNETERLRDAIQRHYDFFRMTHVGGHPANQMLWAVLDEEDDPDEDRMGYEAYQRAKDEAERLREENERLKGITDYYGI